VNGTPLQGLTHSEAITVFKNIKSGEVLLHVGRRDLQARRYSNCVCVCAGRPYLWPDGSMQCRVISHSNLLCPQHKHLPLNTNRLAFCSYVKLGRVQHTPSSFTVGL
jgi:hypothetical protein